MAPVDVIDLLSSSDDEDESPSKLLKTFNVRTNASTAERANGISSTGGSKSSNIGDSRPGSSSIPDGRLGNGTLRAQNGPNHDQPQLNVTPSGFKTWTLPTSPYGLSTQPTLGYPKQAESSRQVENVRQLEKTRQSFTPPALSKEAWNALGTPGRKLQQDLARIQRDLDASRRQSEPQRIARVDKAERYQRQRRLSGGPLQSELTRSPAPRPALGHTVTTETETAAPLAYSVAVPPANASAVGDPAQPLRTSEQRPTDAANSFGRTQTLSIKRPWETSHELAPAKRPRSDPMQINSITQLPKAQLLDVTDPTMERYSTSSEPEPEALAPPAALNRLPLSSALPMSPTVINGMKVQWTTEEDALIKRLKTSGVGWDDIVAQLPGRSKGATKVRYYTQIKTRNESTTVPEVSRTTIATSQPMQQPTPPNSWTAVQTEQDSKVTTIEQQPHAPDITENHLDPGHLTTSRAGPKKSRGRGTEYTASDNALLKKLKEVDRLEWPKIHAYFPGRSLGSLQVHYSTKVKSATLDLSKVVVPPQFLPRLSSQHHTTPQAGVGRPISATVPTAASGSNFGSQYTAEELALLKKLKEEEQLDWKAMVPYFNGRTAGSLQVCWYTKIRQGGPARQAPDLHRSDSNDHVRSKRSRKSHIAATHGFVSWADARSLMRDGANVDEGEDTASETTAAPLAHQDNVFPRSMDRMLRQRELGSVAGTRAWTSSRCTLPEELKNNVYKDYSLQQYYHGTSGDVVGLSWASTGKKFAAGSIAITDNQSMQYNMSRNLLVGDYRRVELQELVEHHVPRPLVDEVDNPNALGAMRHTQDQRLFLTVTATSFSPLPGQEDSLYTAGTDKMLRRYLVGTDIKHTIVEHAAEHAASVDLLAMHQEGLVATGCHSAIDSINVFRSGSTSLVKVWTGTPRRKDLQTTTSIFPSTLKWGEAYVHRNFLLAGFSGDSTSSAEDKRLAGETALWDMEHQRQLEIKGIIRNVFDVCWNPRPSSTSVVFAVASNATGMNFSRGMRTAVSCYAPSQPLSAVVRWQCPALDINDVLICPYNDHLVAAGATDGKVYVWDQRWAAAGQAPLHVLSHGDTLNVLPHGYDQELTDTGVRFLSWGTTSSRLYSGSSDGVVKVWNPYRSEDNAHVEDIDVPRQHRSAIMSGAFSPDHCELLVGTENGRIDVFKMGRPVGAAQQFRLHTAAKPQVNSDQPQEAANALLRSGEITLRPCGAMPLTQAVQGEFYRGPFSAPTSLEFTNAEEKFQQALNVQADLAAKRAQEGYIDPYDPALEKAQVRVRDAQAAIDDLQKLADFVEEAGPKAEAFQQSLIQAENARDDLLARVRERFGSDVAPCNHDCAYLPTSEELEDDDRSKLRIPGVLRNFGTAGVALSQLQDHDKSAERCWKCFPLRVRPRGSKLELCFTCKLEGMRLTTSCSVCSAPARVETDENKQPLCEACAFVCFRCAGPVKILKCSTSLTCESCQLTWSAGVLGYELETKPDVKNAVKSKTPPREEYDDFGSAEIERLMDGWYIEQD